MCYALHHIAVWHRFPWSHFFDEVVIFAARRATPLRLNEVQLQSYSRFKCFFKNRTSTARW